MPETKIPMLGHLKMVKQNRRILKEALRAVKVLTVLGLFHKTKVTMRLQTTRVPWATGNQVEADFFFLDPSGRVTSLYHVCEPNALAALAKLSMLIKEDGKHEGARDEQ